MARELGNDSGPEIPVRIPSAHARALSSHFKTVEEYLRVVESSLEGFQGVFYASSADVPAAQRARIRNLAAAILDNLRRVKRDLRLQAIEGSSVGVARAYLSELWVSLVETRGTRLRGFGEVPDDLAAYLDRHVGDLESQVNEIRTIIEDVARAAKPGTSAGPQRLPE